MRSKKELSPIERYKSAFPDRLRTLMHEKGITQQELANSIDKSRPVVGSYANGIASPDLDTLVKIARYFGVSTDYLLGESEYTKPDTAQLTAEDMGLSEEAAKRLITLAQSDDEFSRMKKQVLNFLLVDDEREEWGDYFLQSLSNFVCSKPIPDKLVMFPSGDFECTNVLYDQVLKNRILKAAEDLKYHFHNGYSTAPKTLSSVNKYILTENKEDSDNGIPKTEDN